jgi:cytochrome c biogenesis protein CcmG, thiol:disulfide interchange protein DsbE
MIVYRRELLRTGLFSRKYKIAFIALLIGIFLKPCVSSEQQSRRISSQFHVKLFDETVITSKEIKGKVTVIDFWGTWCKPCLAEIPDYNAFYRDYKNRGVVFMGLAGESGNAEKVKERSGQFNICYPVGAPSRDEFKTIGKISAYPTTWVIAPSGEIIKEFVGIVPGKQDALRKIVDRLLSETSSSSEAGNR